MDITADQVYVQTEQAVIGEAIGNAFKDGLQLK